MGALFSSGSKQSGTNVSTPNLSDYWKNAFSNVSGAINPSGATPTQQGSLDWLNNTLKTNNAESAATDVNNFISGNTGLLGQTYFNNWQPLMNQPAYQLGAAPQATANTGADFMGAYKNSFDNDVINSSVNDYNTNVDRTLNGLRAGRDASGAFGDRAAIADSSYLGDATRGLGSLVSGLRQSNFNTAAGLGQQDASRFTQNSQYNTGVKGQYDLANLAAKQAGDQQKIQAIQGSQGNLAQIAQNAQNTLGNTLTAQNTNTDLAKTILTGGSIPFDQLMSILGGAQASNGSTTTGTGSGSQTQSPVSTGADIGKTIALLSLAGFCWVAREVYGEENPQWKNFRTWLFVEAPEWMLSAYSKYGERFAAWLKNKPKSKYIVRGIMEWCLK